jgi:hypothetical protein
MNSLKQKLASIRRHVQYDDGADAFVPDFRSGFAPVVDSDVEALGESFVLGATSNDAVGELLRDAAHPAECNGFVFDLEDEQTLELGWL